MTEFSLEHMGLAAMNPTTLKDWYLRILNAQLVHAIEGEKPAYFLKLAGGTVMIEIYSAAAPNNGSENSVQGWRHLALRCANVDETFTRLRELGVAFEEQIKPAGGGGRILFFRDPEGNLLHLVERPSDSPFNTGG